MRKVVNWMTGDKDRISREKATYEQILEKITDFDLAYDEWMRDYGYYSGLTRCRFQGQYLYLSQIEDLINRPPSLKMTNEEAIRYYKGLQQIKERLKVVRKMVKTIVINASENDPQLKTVNVTARILSDVVYENSYLPAIAQVGIKMSNSYLLLSAEQIEELQEAINHRIALIDAEIRRYGMKRF